VDSGLRWCQAIFYAGTTLYLWNETPELKAAFLSLCSLDEGVDVLVIGKYVEESGLGPAIRSVVGSSGRPGLLLREGRRGYRSRCRS
jgi:hypothetical protein